MRVAALVDDNVDIRGIARVLLERAGATIGFEASSIGEVLRRLDRRDDGVVVLDHQLDGSVEGLDGAAAIRSHAPGVRIVLFTSLDLADLVDDSPDIDAFLRKDRILDLPGVVRRLAEEPREVLTAEDILLAEWLATPSLLFGDLPPPLDAAEVVHQLFEPSPGRTDAFLRFVAASGDVDQAVAHLLALRQLIERDATVSGLVDRTILDVLIVEVTSNVLSAARRASTVDPLTGLANRRALDSALASSLARCERMQQVLTVVAFDLDEAGDRALEAFARALERSSRAGDGCYRVGSDEFVAVLPNASTDDAVAFVDRLAACEPAAFSWGSADTRDCGYEGPRLLRLSAVRLRTRRYGRHAPDVTSGGATPGPGRSR